MSTFPYTVFFIGVLLVCGMVSNSSAVGNKEVCKNWFQQLWCKTRQLAAAAVKEKGSYKHKTQSSDCGLSQDTLFWSAWFRIFQPWFWLGVHSCTMSVWPHIVEKYNNHFDNFTQKTHAQTQNIWSMKVNRYSSITCLWRYRSGW